MLKIKTKFNIIVDILGFFSFLIISFSGIVLWRILPRGSYQGGRGITTEKMFFGLDRHNWTDIHNYIALVFIALILIHLILHWHWIKSLPKLISGK